ITAEMVLDLPDADGAGERTGSVTLGAHGVSPAWAAFLARVLGATWLGTDRTASFRLPDDARGSIDVVATRGEARGRLTARTPRSDLSLALGRTDAGIEGTLSGSLAFSDALTI